MISEPRGLINAFNIQNVIRLIKNTFRTIEVKINETKIFCGSFNILRPYRFDNGRFILRGNCFGGRRREIGTAIGAERDRTACHKWGSKSDKIKSGLTLRDLKSGRITNEKKYHLFRCIFRAAVRRRIFVPLLYGTEAF